MQMGLKPSKPNAPDPVALAGQQMQYGTDAARQTQNLNAVDRTTPFGTASYQRDAAGNISGMTSSLNPALTAVGNKIGKAAKGLAGALPTTAFDSTTVAPGQIDIGKTLYDKGVSLMEPQWQQTRNAQDVQLTNRGLPIGSEARNIAEGNLSRQHDLALADLASTANLASSQEQQRLINNARTDYQMPAQQLSAQLGNMGLLAGLTPQASLPSVNVSAPNFAGMSMDAYNQQMQQYNADMAGLGNIAKLGLGVAAAPFTGGASLGGAGLIGGMSSMFNGPAQGFPTSNGWSTSPSSWMPS